MLLTLRQWSVKKARRQANLTQRFESSKIKFKFNQVLLGSYKCDLSKIVTSEE